MIKKSYNLRITANVSHNDTSNLFFRFILFLKVDIQFFSTNNYFVSIKYYRKSAKEEIR